MTRPRVKIRPSGNDLNAIRVAAKKAAAAQGSDFFCILPIVRVDMDTHATSMNKSLLGDNQDHYDKAQWTDFSRGFLAAQGGKGCVEFAVYSSDRDGEDRRIQGDLVTHVTAYFDNFALTEIKT